MNTSPNELVTLIAAIFLEDTVKGFSQIYPKTISLRLFYSIGKYGRTDSEYFAFEIKPTTGTDEDTNYYYKTGNSPGMEFWIISGFTHSMMALLVQTSLVENGTELLGWRESRRYKPLYETTLNYLNEWPAHARQRIATDLIKGLGLSEHELTLLVSSL